MRLPCLLTAQLAPRTHGWLCLALMQGQLKAIEDLSALSECDDVSAFETESVHRLSAIYGSPAVFVEYSPVSMRVVSSPSHISTLIHLHFPDVQQLMGQEEFVKHFYKHPERFHLPVTHADLQTCRATMNFGTAGSIQISTGTSIERDSPQISLWFRQEKWSLVTSFCAQQRSSVRTTVFQTSNVSGSRSFVAGWHKLLPPLCERSEPFPRGMRSFLSALISRAHAKSK